MFKNYNILIGLHIMNEKKDDPIPPDPDHSTYGQEK